MYTSRFLNKAFSVLALICLGFMQLMPVSVSAAPLTRPANDAAVSCSLTATTFRVCFADGSTPEFNDRISVTSAVTHTTTFEGLKDIGGLTANVGDTVHVPFAITYIYNNAACPTIPAFSPTLQIDAGLLGQRLPLAPTTISFPTVAVNGNSVPGLKYEDGIVGPFGSSLDTVYGAFDFIVNGTDGVPSNGNNITFKLDTGNWLCGLTDYSKAPGQNLLNSKYQPARQVHVSGAAFTLDETGIVPVPTYVSVTNSLDIPITITNTGTAATFAITTTVSPATPALPVTYPTLAFAGAAFKGDGTDTLNTGGVATGDVLIGPIPQGYGQSITVTITVVGTSNGTPSTRQLVITLPVYQPAVSIAITSDKALYKPGETALYTITIKNSGQLTLGNFTLIDNLDSPVTGLPSTLAVGSAPIIINFSYLIKSTDANPLIDKATVSAYWDPTTTGDTGSPVLVTSNTTYQVNVVSANVNLSFGPKSPTPNYAQPGTAINGTVVIANTGTQDVNNVVTTVSLVDGADATKVYATGILTRVTSTLLAGDSFPAAAFSLTLPVGLAPEPDTVNLVITLTGVTSQGVTINRKLTQPLDVVTSALHVIVTSDAPSGVVARGQVITYTVTVQNISAIPVTGIQLGSITADAQQLYTGTPVSFDLTAANTSGDTYTLPASYVNTFTAVGTTANPLLAIATATFGGANAIGRLSLAITDVQLAVNDNATCIVANVGDDCSAAGAKPIPSSNQVSPKQIVRFGVLLQNVGQSDVTGVTACSDTPCAAITWDNGTPGSLSTLGSPALGHYYVTIPANATSPFTTVLTVSVKDQNNLIVLFRASATLQVVSSNLYWTITKTAATATQSAAPINVFVGDTVIYTVKACYTPDPSLSSPPLSLTNVTATDPFSTTANHQLMLTVNANPPALSVSLNKGDCAQSTYQVVMDDKVLGDAPGPIQLTNVVTLKANSIPDATQSATVNLSNPLKVTKLVNALTAHAGEPVTYSYSFTNLSSQAISGFTAVDNLLPDAFKNLTIPLPTQLDPKGTIVAGKATDTFSTSYQTTAAPVDGPGDSNIINTVSAKGTINGVTDGASATAKLDVLSPLLVHKSVNHPGPFAYDPAITYTVTIQNVSTATVQLDDVSDTLANKASPPVDNTIMVTVGTNAPVALKGLQLAAGATGTFTYQALPTDLLALSNGSATFTNKVTITAEVGDFAHSKGGVFTTNASATVTIFQPLIVINGCPDFSYYGWNQVSHWHFSMTNGSAVDNPYGLTNIAVTVSGLTGISGLTLSTNTLAAPGLTDTNYSKRPRATSDFDWTVPWQSPLLDFNSVTFKVTYTATQGTKSTDFQYSFGVTDVGCYGDKVGPPLTVIKTPSVANAVVGDTVTYTLTVQNQMHDDPKLGAGSGSVTNITAVDLTFAPNTNLVLNFPSGNQTLKPGETASLTVPISHTVTGSDPSPLINKVYVSGKLSNVTFPTPIIGIATVILPNPLIVMTLLADHTNVLPGDLITYSATITNNSQTDIMLNSASTDSTTVSAINIPSNSIVLHGGGIFQLPNLYQVIANSDPRTTGPFTSTLTLTYTVQTTPTTTGTTAASTTVNVDNPNLRVLLTTQPAIVVTYGQTIVYKEEIYNPSTTADTILSVTHVLLAPGDAVSDWKKEDANQTPIAATLPAGFSLDAGLKIYRTVTHLVTTIDNSPLRFVVTANGQYTPACPAPCTTTPTPISVADTKISNVTISSAQLLLYANADKLSVSPGDNDNISLTLTNIGSVAITSLKVTATVGDIHIPQTILRTDDVSTIPSIPGSGSVGNQLLPLAATGGNYVVQVPTTASPNPLVVTFTASGTTAEGLQFQDVTTTLILHILQPNINIIETPEVAAVPLNGSVTYDVVVTNPGVPDLTVVNVVDKNSGAPITLKFPNSGTVLKTNESARGTTTVQVTNLVPNPYVHSSTVTGQIPAASGPPTTVTDTYASTVNVLGSGLTATYTASPSQSSIGGLVTFTVTVTNTSNIAINNLVATDIDHGGGASIVLIDPITNKATTSLASNASATGTFTYSPTQVGSFVEHVQITGIDATLNKVAASASAPFSVIGIGLAFVLPPTPDKATAKVGDVVTFSFTLKNTANGTVNDLTNIGVVCISNTCTTLSPALPLLPADGTTSVTEQVAYTVKASDALTGTVKLTFQATGTQVNTLNTASVTAIGQFNVTTGGLLLTKTANPTSGKPGDTITYTVSVTNSNPTSAITFSSLADTLAGDVLGVLKLAGNTLPANGGTASGTYTYVIPVGAPATITNSVTATFIVGAGAAQTSTATANVAVTSPSSGNMTVVVTPSVSAAKVGDQVTYTIAVTNSGTTTINNLAATSSLGNTINVSGTISPKQTVYFTSSAYQIPLGATGQVTNIITVTGTDSTGTRTAVGSASVIIIGPSGLSVTKTASATTAKAGDTITYTIQITNYGTGALKIGSVTDSDGGADLTALSSLNNVSLAAGTQAAPIIVKHTVSASDPVTIQDVVTVTATDATSTTISNTASATVLNTTGSNGLIVSAVPNKTVAFDGDIVTYTVTIANVSSGVTAMTINNLTATFAQPGQAIPTPITTLLVSSLAPGTQTSTTFNTTASVLVNPLVLLVTAKGTDVNSKNYVATSATAPVTVGAVGALYSASLSADHTNIPPAGSVINFTFTLVNTGNVPLTNIFGEFNNSTTLAALFGPNQTGLANVMFNRSAFLPVAATSVVFPTLSTPLGVGSSESVFFSYTVKAADTTRTTPLVAAVDLTVTVTVNGVTTTTKTTTPFTASILPTPASLTVGTPTSTCAAAPATCTVKPGDSIPLKFIVANTGSVDLTTLTYTINGVSFTPTSPTGTPVTSLLASASPMTLNYNYSVPSAMPGANPVSLIITATDTNTTATYNSPAFLYTVINPTMSVSITSPVFPATVADLSTTTFNMVVTNTSSTVPLMFNSGNSLLTITGTSGGATLSSQTITYTDANKVALPNGVLAPGGIAYATATYTIKSTDPTALSVVFSAKGCATPNCTVSVVNAAGGQITVTRATATPTLSGTVTATTGTTVCTTTNGLTISQTADQTTVKPGAAINFKIIVTNSTGAGVSGIALNDTLPTGFTAGTGTTDVGSSVVTGNALTVAIGTLNAQQSANITLAATVGSKTASGTFTNTASVTVAGVSSSTPCSAVVTITVANSASVLPVTGFSSTGTDSGLTGGLLILIMLLSSVLVFGMTINRNNNRGSGNNPLLLAGGLLAILVVLLLLAIIGVSLINKARTAPGATGTAAALNPTAIIVTLPGKTYVAPTRTPVGAPPTIAPTLTEVPPNTPIPPPSAVPTAAPPFQPVGEKSFFMPRLQIPGGAVGLPITELPLVNSTWNVNSLGHIVGHLAETSWLGDTGNTVLVAHIQLAYNDYGPFLRLGDAQLGDLIYVSDHGRFYTYQVVDIKKVNPTDVQVTYPTPNPILTLITCTTWDAQKGAFAQRLVVMAKLIKSPDYSA